MESLGFSRFFLGFLGGRVGFGCVCGRFLKIPLGFGGR